MNVRSVPFANGRNESEENELPSNGINYVGGWIVYLKNELTIRDRLVRHPNRLKLLLFFCLSVCLDLLKMFEKDTIIKSLWWAHFRSKYYFRINDQKSKQNKINKQTTILIWNIFHRSFFLLRFKFIICHSKWWNLWCRNMK